MEQPFLPLQPLRSPFYTFSLLLSGYLSRLPEEEEKMMVVEGRNFPKGSKNVSQQRR